MLSLLDPVEMEGLVIFRDDADARKFYLLPDQPVIPVDDEGEPEFLFIKFIRDVDTAPDANLGGGYLQFRTSLTVDQARRAKVMDALRTRLVQEKAAGRKPLGLTIDSTEPLLAAPLWTDGKVGMATFQVSDAGLVRHATGSVPADLSGDLGASLNLQLDPDGAEIFWSAFQDRDQHRIPILITYELTYKARVSASMTIHAERKVIRRRIEEQARPYRLLSDRFIRYVPIEHPGPFTLSMLPAIRAQAMGVVAAMIPRPKVQEIVQQCIVENQVKVDIRMDEGGSGEESAKLRELIFKLATDVLSERVIPALFGDNAGQPGASSAARDNANVELFEVKADNAAMADMKFDLTFDHQSTIERKVNPNGPVELMIRDPQALASCFKQLRLSDGFFKVMRVTAKTAGVKFAEDGIDTVKVEFDYDQVDELHPQRLPVRRSKDGVLKNETEAVHWRFDTARRRDGSHIKDYRYRTIVVYNEGPVSRSEWLPSSAEALMLTPRVMGALRVETVLTASKTVVLSARVSFEHVAPSGTKYTAAFELTPENGRKTWLQYTGELGPLDSDLNPPAYTYQVAYRLASGGELKLGRVASNEQTLEIGSPFKRLLTFTVRPQGSFEGVSSITGDLIYDDPEHQYKVLSSFQLTSLTASHTFELPVLEGGPEKVKWTARRLRTTGPSEDLGSGTSGPGTVWIGSGAAPLDVEIRTDLLDFETDVQLAVVQLTYLDPANGIEQRKTFTFSKAAAGPQRWTVGRAPDGPSKYDAHIRFIAIDRTKSSEKTLRQIEDQVLLLDRLA